MKLQILIAHYNESENLVLNLLNSINNQLGIDFKNSIEAVICNDGISVPIPIEILSKYKFKIKYIMNQHEGVSYTRNTLLDASNSDYIMFCDSDDMFCDQLGLYSILEAIKDKNPDVFISPFYEETREHKFILRELDSNFVHGKVFRRQYLLDNDIRFHSDLIFFGDPYFLKQALGLTSNMVYSKIPFYIWCWNDNSICRKEKNHLIKSYAMKLRGDKLLTENFIKRDRIDLAKMIVLNSIQDMYFKFYTKSWYDLRYTEEIKEAQKQFVDFYNSFKNLYDEIDDKTKMKSYNTILLSRGSNGPQSGYLGLEPWLIKIVSLYTN